MADAQYTTTTAQQHVSAFRELLIGASAAGRRGLNNFWGAVRLSLNQQEAQITTLALQVQQLKEQIQTNVVGGGHSRGSSHSTAVQTPARPPTSNSVVAVRDAVQQSLVDDANAFDSASNTILDIADVPSAWATSYISGKRTYTTSLGCWLSSNAPAHRNGYQKTNLRNTAKPNTGGKFTTQPFMHQLAIVAKGDGSLLRLCSDWTDSEKKKHYKTHEVSV